MDLNWVGGQRPPSPQTRQKKEGRNLPEALRSKRRWGGGTSRRETEGRGNVPNFSGDSCSAHRGPGDGRSAHPPRPRGAIQMQTHASRDGHLGSTMRGIPAEGHVVKQLIPHKEAASYQLTRCRGGGTGAQGQEGRGAGGRHSASPALKARVSAEHRVASPQPPLHADGIWAFPVKEAEKLL